MFALEQEEGWYMKKQSRYLTIVRIMAYILRFATNCRVSCNTRLTEEISTKEFVVAELTVLRLSQQESFSDKNELRLNTLDVYKDNDGLLRLKPPVTAMRMNMIFGIQLY